MLWIAKKLNVDLLKLTTAKALCANTVRHLMKDERSTNAVDAALAFGRGEIGEQELKIACINVASVAHASADKKDNQLQTANICREVLTDVVFEAINNLKQ